MRCLRGSLVEPRQREQYKRRGYWAIKRPPSDVILLGHKSCIQSPRNCGTMVLIYTYLHYIYIYIYRDIYIYLIYIYNTKRCKIYVISSTSPGCPDRGYHRRLKPKALAGGFQQLRAFSGNPYEKDHRILGSTFLGLPMSGNLQLTNRSPPVLAIPEAAILTCPRLRHIYSRFCLRPQPRK